MTAITLSMFASQLAAAEVQTLFFDRAPAWYFISLQVDPYDPDPDAVFPVAGSFRYDHLWSWDGGGEGWRHYSPVITDATLRGLLNDLRNVDPLQGYWIHVTRIPYGGFELEVSGDAVVTQRIEGAAWHAIGPLSEAEGPARPVADVFRDLGVGMIQDSVDGLWRYDAALHDFAQISDYEADCTGDPGECLKPGRGYWIRTTGDVSLGSDVVVRPRDLLFRPEDPITRIKVEALGSAPVAMRLTLDGPSEGFSFVGAGARVVDGFEMPIPSRGASVDGPDREIDLDRDGVADEPCPDLCAGEDVCVNLCFDSIRHHTVYLGLDMEVIAGESEFTSLDGLPYAELLLESLSAGSGARAAAASSGIGEVRQRLKIALKPSIVTGTYAGSMTYEMGGSGSIPLKFLVDCTPPDPESGQAGGCEGSSVTAVMNPTILGSTSNGLDDDSDGDVDEADEAAALIRLRDGVGFPADSPFYGSLSGDNLRLRLAGDVAASASELGSGITSFFAGSERRLEFDGRRANSNRFTGTFTDRYVGIDLAGSEATLAARGRFALNRIAAPQCVAPSSDPSLPALPLDIPCRLDGDCPMRCVGDTPESDVAGLACSVDDDCNPPGTTSAATCEPFPCAFTELSTPELLRRSDVSVSGSVELQESEFEGILAPVVEVQLAGGGVHLLSAGEGTPCGLQNDSTCFDLGGMLSQLPCGREVSLRFAMLGCDETLTTVSVACDGSSEALLGDVACHGEVALPQSLPVALEAGGYRVTAGFTAAPHPGTLTGELAEETLELVGSASESASVAPDGGLGWTNLFQWPPLPERIRAGLLALLDGDSGP